jgi:hypothetical protein
MPARLRWTLALAIGAASLLLCYYRLCQRGQLAADFTFPWRAARLLIEGQNPYTEIRPEGEYPFQTYFYYPLTAALAALPFAALPPEPAGAVFFGISSGLLAYALSRGGWQRLTVFLGAPYWVALGVAQWSPLLAAAVLLPGLGWLLAIKPNNGLAGLIYRPDWRSFVGAAAFGVISLFVQPGWPRDWLAVLDTLEGHPPAVLVLPFGPLLLLSALRWRRPDGRLLLSLSLFPQLLFFYDQLLLGLIPRSAWAGLVCAGLSWVAFFAWRAVGADPLTGEVLLQPDQYVIALVYLPALALVLWQKADR